MAKQKIGWFIGLQKWAYRNLVNRLIDALPEYEHVINKRGDLNILLAVDQLLLCDPDNSVILHIDGNRWQETQDPEYGIRKLLLELGADSALLEGCDS